jgi:hypothetical protein
MEERNLNEECWSDQQLVSWEEREVWENIRKKESLSQINVNALLSW